MKALYISLGTLFSMLVFALAINGGMTLYQEAFPDYDSHLTAQVFQDTYNDKNVNLVFYKRSCPYCKAGKTDVIRASKSSQYPTFFVDVESDAGQALKEQYQIESADTIVSIRSGKAENHVYGKTVNDKAVSDKKEIEVAFK